MTPYSDFKYSILNRSRCGLRAGFLVLGFAIASVASSEPYLWRQVKVGAGGFAPNIIYSRVEPGLAYLRTDMGGLYRWHAAAKRWIPLQDGMAQSSYFGIESVALDPVDANVVYVAAGMYRRDGAAILGSRDRGTTWEIFPTPFVMGGNEDGRGLGERLAVDPGNRTTLYFGSRHDGLQRSFDSGKTWQRIDSFPLKGLGVPPRGQPANAGISFVVFSEKTVLAGAADPGEAHLFRSDDGGHSWQAVAGQPRADLLPAKAEVDARGVVYITYSNRIGPSGVTAGAVYQYDLRSGEWTDITPEKGPNRAPGGYMGISLDRQRPNTLLVASMNRWQPGDTVWRSLDGGKTWRSLLEQSHRDVTATPFLLWGNPEANFGWWMAGLAIDPFDSNFAAYTTGATVYATRELSAADRSKNILWQPWVEGIEQTAVLTLTSLPEGPPLLSGFGDISGFAHASLDQSPRDQFTNPVFANTNTIDYAGRSPNVVVRSGTTPHRDSGNEPTLAYSLDHGRHWQALRTPAPSGDAAIIASASGSTFIVMTPTPSITRDRGKSWSLASGLPEGARPVADRVVDQTFYALDFDRAKVFVSRDDGRSFAILDTQGLPSDIKGDRPAWREMPWPLMATPGKPGDLWFVSRSGLFHSKDGGLTFTPARGDVDVQALSFGKAPPRTDYPALFAIGAQRNSGIRAIWRSDTAGETWIRVNDAAHEYGRRFRCISGDPRVFGRVYVGTDGRGIVYGEPAAAANH